MAKQTKNENSEQQIDTGAELKDFNWDTSTLNFFDQEEEIEESSLTPREIEALKESSEIKTKEVDDEDDENDKNKKDDKKDDKNKDKKDDKKKKNDDLDDDDDDEDIEDVEEKFFEKEKSEIEDTTDEEDDGKDKSLLDDSRFFKVLATSLKEKGVFSNIDIPEDEEIDENTFVELQDKEVDARVDEVFKRFFEELDEDGASFLKYKQKGGNTSDFFETIKTKLPDQFDIATEDGQIGIVKHYLRVNEELEADEIDDRIDWLKDNDKLERYAQNYQKKLQRLEKEKQEKLLKQQEDLKKERQKRSEEFSTTVSEKLTKNSEIKGFPITKKDKNELLDYITKPTIKVGTNRYVTQLQDDLRKVGEDTESLILLAKLLKSNFDITDVQTKMQTKNVKQLKTNLQRLQSTAKPVGGGGKEKKQLSDYFTV